jgi:hypothetical protein
MSSRSHAPKLPEPGSRVDGMSVEVWAKGAPNYYWQTSDMSFIPRTGEFVRFADGRGRVESVTWMPSDRGLIVRVECVPT